MPSSKRHKLTSRSGLPTRERPSIDLRHLRYFLALADELHFGRAAARLHMAQPALSRAIRKLERDLGVPLFDRTTRRVTVTDAGRAFAAHARDVLSSLDLAVRDARRAGGTGSALQVGFTPYLPMEQLLLFLGALHAREPEARVGVDHAVAAEQLTRLGDGSLDVAILPWAHDGDGLELEPLFSGEPLAAFLPAGHALALRTTLAPADLAGETVISFPRSVNPPLADWLRARMDEAGYRFRERREDGSPEARDWILAVAAGEGVGLLPHRFKEFADVGGLVTRRPLEPALSMPETVAAWRADAPAELRPLLEAVRGVARELRRQS